MVFRWGRTTAFAVAVLVVLAACGHGSDEALKPVRPETTFTGPPITEKNPTFHQAVYLDHPGSEIRVVDVSALTSPNVTYLGAVAIWPRDLKSGNVGGGPKFPPPAVREHHPFDEVVPATETAIVPAGWNGPASVTIALGFRLEGLDPGAVNGFRVVYEVDGERKVLLERIAIIACLKPKACDGPGFEEPDFGEGVLRKYGLLPD